MVPKGTNFRNFLVTYTLVCKISSTVLHDSCRRDSYTSRNKSTPYLLAGQPAVRLRASQPSEPRPGAARPGARPRAPLFHSPDWRYAAISLGAQVGVRIDPPTLEAI